MTFTGLVAQEYLRLLAIRVQERMPILANKWLWAAVSASLLLQVIILYTPFGSTAFGTVALGIEQWGVLRCRPSAIMGHVRGVENPRV